MTILKKIFIIIFTIILMDASVIFNNAQLIVLQAQEPTPTVYQNAKKAVVNTSNVRIRVGPSTSYEQLVVDGVKRYYGKNQDVSVVGECFDESGDLWYQVTFLIGSREYTAWCYAEYITFVYDEPVTPAPEQNDPVEQETPAESYEDTLRKQGFPEDYIPALVKLHNAHPSWTFEAYVTGLSWSTVVAKESRLGHNLINGSNIALRSVATGAYDVDKAKFIPFDGTTWFCANEETIAYYIDPRNWLTENDMFQFLNLSFRASETTTVIQKLLNNTFMAGSDPVTGKKYADIFFNAGKAAKVSAVYLAALAKQEQGVTGSKASSGEAFTYNSKTYKGLYNFYNIGATSGTDNWKKGLVWANGGEAGTSTSYSRPWKSPEAAITGGASFIAHGYIAVGQDTMYFQKFNVTAYKTYSHQYQTNVRAAYSQGRIMYNTFNATGSLDLDLVFSIPVYKGMPTKTALPTTYTLPTKDNPVVDTPSPETPITPLPDNPGTSQQQPENKPEDNVTEPVYTGDFIVDLDLMNSNGYLTGFNLGMTYEELQTKLGFIAPKLELKITDSEGKALSMETLLATGQKLVVADESGESNYFIVMKGDINGDGKINAKDLLMMKKDLLNETKLSGIQLKAACVNNEASVSLKGYLALKKHYLGVAEIEQ